MYRAHCAVIFAVAQLSCFQFRFKCSRRLFVQDRMQSESSTLTAQQCWRVVYRTTSCWTAPNASNSIINIIANSLLSVPVKNSENAVNSSSVNKIHLEQKLGSLLFWATLYSYCTNSQQSNIHQQKTDSSLHSVTTNARLSLVATIFITSSKAKQRMRLTDMDYTRTVSPNAVIFFTA